MDNSVERDKWIEEIQKEYQVASAYHPESQFMSMSKSNVSFLLSEFSRLQVERDKAIDGLRWYADESIYEPWRCAYTEDETSPSDADNDKGDKARTILSELGVPHDPLD